jgi:hypothetical protein
MPPPPTHTPTTHTPTRPTCYLISPPTSYVPEAGALLPPRLTAEISFFSVPFLPVQGHWRTHDWSVSFLLGSLCFPSCICVPVLVRVCLMLLPACLMPLHIASWCCCCVLDAATYSFLMLPLVCLILDCCIGARPWYRYVQDPETCTCCYV